MTLLAKPNIIYIWGIVLTLPGILLLIAEAFIPPALYTYTSQHHTIPNKKCVINPRGKNHKESFLRHVQRLTTDTDENTRKFRIKKTERIRVKSEFGAINKRLEKLKLKQEQVEKILEKASKEFEESEKEKRGRREEKIHGESEDFDSVACLSYGSNQKTLDTSNTNIKTESRRFRTSHIVRSQETTIFENFININEKKEALGESANEKSFSMKNSEFTVKTQVIDDNYAEEIEFLDPRFRQNMLLETQLEMKRNEKKLEQNKKENEISRGITDNNSIVEKFDDYQSSNQSILLSKNSENKKIKKIEINSATRKESTSEAKVPTKAQSIAERVGVAQKTTGKTSQIFNTYQFQKSLLEARLRLEKRKNNKIQKTVESSCANQIYDKTTLNNKTQVEIDSVAMCQKGKHRRNKKESVEKSQITKQVSEPIENLDPYLFQRSLSEERLKGESKFQKNEIESIENTKVIEQDLDPIKRLDSYLFQRALLEDRLKRESKLRTNEIDSIERTKMIKQDSNGIKRLDSYIFQRSLLEERLKRENKLRTNKIESIEKNKKMKQDPEPFENFDSYVFQRSLLEDRLKRENKLRINGKMKAIKQDSMLMVCLDSYQCQKALLEDRLKRESKLQMNAIKSIENTSIVKQESGTTENLDFYLIQKALLETRLKRESKLRMSEIESAEGTKITRQNSNPKKCSDFYQFQRRLLEERLKRENTIKSIKETKIVKQNSQIFPLSLSDANVGMDTMTVKETLEETREFRLKRTLSGNTKAIDEESNVPEDGISNTSDFDLYPAQKALLKSRLDMDKHEKGKSPNLNVMQIEPFQKIQRTTKSNLGGGKKLYKTTYTEISEKIIETLTPDEGFKLLMKKDDAEILIFLIFRIALAFLEGSRVIWFGFRAANGDDTKSDIISTLATSAKKIVSIVPAVAALGFKQGDRIQKFIENYVIEESREIERDNAVIENDIVSKIRKNHV